MEYTRTNKGILTFLDTDEKKGEERRGEGGATGGNRREEQLVGLA